MSLPPSSSLVTVCRARHHRRPGDEHVRGAFDHHRIVAGHKPRGAEARDRAEAERDHRHGRHVGHDPVPRRIGRHVGVALRLDRLDRAAAAGAVHQAHQRQAQLVRHLLGHHLLLPDRRVGRAAAHREIVAADHDRPAVDPAAAEHEIRRLERLELAVLAVLGAAGERADLVEAAGIEQRVDALAHGELAGVVLALDLVGPAHVPRERLAAAQFLDIGFPAQVTPRASTPLPGDYTIPRADMRAGDMAEIRVPSELNAIVWKIEVAAGRCREGGRHTHHPRGHENGNPGRGAARRHGEGDPG